MYNSGDAAEQVVRISLEGTEVALKLTGSAAKNNDTARRRLSAQICKTGNQHSAR